MTNINTAGWHRKHLLDIESLTAEEINVVHDTTRAFKAVGERAIKKVPALRGKTVINLFIEPSTRTRISFELAAMRLTADVINFSTEASSLKKGETLKDTARNLEALERGHHHHPPQRDGSAALPVPLPARQRDQRRRRRARTSHAGVARHVYHPRKERPIAGLNVTILGDILYSRVARSNIHALLKLGANVTLCGPSTLVPKVFEQMGCKRHLQRRRSHCARRTSSTSCASSTNVSARRCSRASANTRTSSA
jgi:aspartate carbamoyltransferase catalytic subunit